MLSNNQLKNLAKRAGFSDCGVTSPAFLPDNRSALEEWTKSGFHGDMKFLESNNHIRENISFLFPEVKSVIVCLLNYKQENENVRLTNLGKISHYALGDDYHFVIKNKMMVLLDLIREIIPDTKGKYFTDSAPIFEREYAKRAGLGWIGKNTLLLNKTNGSYFFIGVLLIDQLIENDSPISSSHCGSCTSCIDNCPTNAIRFDGMLDATKCTSYLTIEKKGTYPDENLTTQNWVWGCDICQDVCPWNLRFSKATNVEEFAPNEKLINLTLPDLEMLSENGFKREFSKSPIIRRGKKGLIRNIYWAKKWK